MLLPMLSELSNKLTNLKVKNDYENNVHEKTIQLHLPPIQSSVLCSIR